ncbi:MAG: PTS sugar transporter subunit IIA [Rhodanobacter sp.]|jgi:PTS system nitrogen regulatory IIA component|nr:PTS sugar transporter subunit IIA [Rhodanobacter sp.]
MHFLDLLSAERVCTGLAVNDKAGLIDHLAELLAEGGPVAIIREAIATRERLGSTGLGHGIAIPHGRCPQIAEARAAFIRLAKPIDFGASDGQAVDLVAALIVPAHFTDQHLRLLAELAELFSAPSTTAALRAAPDAPALHRLLHRGMKKTGTD